jgi:hypothetical protein
MIINYVVILYYLAYRHISASILSKFFSKSRIIPVFHNLRDENLEKMYPIVQNREIISVSLRNIEAMNNIASLNKIPSSCVVGSSSVTSNTQVFLLKSLLTYFSIIIVIIH